MPDGTSDIWFLGNTSSGERNNVHNILLKGDLVEIKYLLSTPQHTDLFYGLDNAAKSVSTLPPIETPKFILKYQVRILIEIGIINMPKNIAALIQPNENDLTDTIFGLIKLLRANLPSSYSILLPKAFHDSRNSICLPDEQYIHLRAINALYHSIRSCRLLEAYNYQTILEIGPGLGRTLLNLYKSGKICSGLDIPLSIVGQALFFNQICGEHSFILPGEEKAYCQNQINKINL